MPLSGLNPLFLSGAIKNNTQNDANNNNYKKSHTFKHIRHALGVVSLGTYYVKSKGGLSNLFGSDKSDSFSNDAIPNEFKGIKIHQHNIKMTSTESKDFMDTLSNLTENYSGIAGESLKEIHLYGGIKGLKQIPDVWSKFGPKGVMSDGWVTGISDGSSDFKMGINIHYSRTSNLMSAGKKVFLPYKTVSAASDTPLKSTVTHEFGHLFSFDEYKKRGFKNFDQFHKNVLDPLYKKHGVTPQSIDSSYAKTDPKEMIAETFARAHIGGEGHEGAKAVIDELKGKKIEKIMANNKNMIKGLKAMGSSLVR